MILPIINELSIAQEKVDKTSNSSNSILKTSKYDKNSCNSLILVNEINKSSQQYDQSSNKYYHIRSNIIRYHDFSKNNSYLLSSNNYSFSLSQIINHNDTQDNNSNLINDHNKLEIPIINYDKYRKKGYYKFSKEEDLMLIGIVNKFGAKNWKFIGSLMPKKNSKQCRDRYLNYLAPEINLSKWNKEEDDILIEKYQQFGPKWSLIAKFFPNRTANSIKNRCKYSLYHKINYVKYNKELSS